MLFSDHIPESLCNVCVL